MLRRGKSDETRVLPKKHNIFTMMGIMRRLDLCGVEEKVGVVFEPAKEEKREGEHINLKTLVDDEMHRFHLSGEKRLLISMQARFNICLGLLKDLKEIYDKGFRFKQIKIPSSMVMVHDIVLGKASFVEDRYRLLPLVPSEVTANVWGMTDLFAQVLLGTAAAMIDGGLQDLLQKELGNTFDDVQDLIMRMGSGDGVTGVDYCINTLTQLRDAWLKEVISSKQPSELAEEKCQPGLSPRPRH